MSFLIRITEQAFVVRSKLTTFGTLAGTICGDSMGVGQSFSVSVLPDVCLSWSLGTTCGSSSPPSSRSRRYDGGRPISSETLLDNSSIGGAFVNYWSVRSRTDILRLTNDVKAT